MGLLDLVTFPGRLAVAATQATFTLNQLISPEGPFRREGGYGERLMLVIGEGGLVERLAHALADPRGPVALVNRLAAVTAEDRPLGQAMAPGGTLDRLLADDGALQRVLEEGGTLDRLFAEDGPLERLLAAGGALDRVTRPDGALDRLLAEEGLFEQLLREDGFLEKLVAEGGTLDQLVALGATLEGILPRLAELSDVVPELHESVTALSTAVGPLSELADRLPRPRRRNAAQT